MSIFVITSAYDMSMKDLKISKEADVESLKKEVEQLTKKLHEERKKLKDAECNAYIKLIFWHNIIPIILHCYFVMFYFSNV